MMLYLATNNNWEGWIEHLGELNDVNQGHYDHYI